MTDFTITLANGQLRSCSEEDARYDIHGQSGLLTVLDGKGNRWQFSPAGWLSVEDDEPEGVERTLSPRRLR